MTVKRPPLAYDPASPPEGVRLNFADVAAKLRITVTDMAKAAGIGRASIARLINNEWPTRTDQAELREQLTALFVQHGAGADEVATLFHARIGSQARKAFDKVALPEPPRVGRRTRAKTINPEVEEEETMLFAKQTMTRSARQAFGLFRNPFDTELAPDDEIFINADVAYVREACLQAAMNGSFVAVVGESGSGKTTTVKCLEDLLLRDRKPVVVIRPSILAMGDRKPIRAGDVLDAIVSTLDPSVSIKGRMQGRTDQARMLLKSGVEVGNLHLLLIEEAHAMDDNALRLLKRLHEMRLGRRPLLGILLVGQPELKAKLDPQRPSIREVAQRCEIVELLPLDGDVKAYLTHLAKTAGVELGKLIDDGGVEELRLKLTKHWPGSSGRRSATSFQYPLAVNNFMTAAINMAAELGVPIVNRDVVRAV
jgi:type II secretory pathway predicted ATPase ExeA